MIGKLSGMYQSILNQNLISKQEFLGKMRPKKIQIIHYGLINYSDIWFASKSNNYLFNNGPMVKNKFLERYYSIQIKKTEKYPKELIKRIIEASSYKLNWVLDPFSRIGDIGLNAIEMGRRFIGFEANKDKILLSMKKIDRK